MSKEAIKELKQVALLADRRRYPSVPEHARYIRRYSDKTANGLTRCIIDYLRYKGWQVEMVSNTGRPVDGRKRFTDAVGFNREVGTVTWIPGIGTPGKADISATVSGRSVKIEVKAGRDQQSEALKQYQAQVEAAGGTYIVARCFAGFLEWSKEFIK